jgi:hypothetical protein
MLIVDILAPVWNSTLSARDGDLTNNTQKEESHSFEPVFFFVFFFLILFDEQITSRVVRSHILRAAEEISAYIPYPTLRP